jgi:hypothetical protein
MVYLWADGLYVKAGLEDTKAALPVMIGVLTNGQKVVLAVESSQRESKESWGMILRDLRKRASNHGGARLPMGITAYGRHWESNIHNWRNRGAGTIGLPMPWMPCPRNIRQRPVRCSALCPMLRRVVLYR